MFQSFTLGTAGADTTDTTKYTKLVAEAGRDVPNGSHDLGAQVAVVSGMLNGNSGTATIQFVLRDDTPGTTSLVRRHTTVTLTATSIKDTADGSTSSNYRATASPTTVDLAGMGEKDPATGRPLAWYVGASAYGTVTGGRMDLALTRAI